MYVAGERRFVLGDRDVMFDQCESQLRRVGGYGSLSIKISTPSSMKPCLFVPMYLSRRI